MSDFVLFSGVSNNTYLFQSSCVVSQITNISFKTLVWCFEKQEHLFQSPNTQMSDFVLLSGVSNNKYLFQNSCVVSRETTTFVSKPLYVVSNNTYLFLCSYVVP